MINNNLYEAIYGVCEGINFPCFIRLIFKVNDCYKIQVLNNNELFLETIECDFTSNEYIKITPETFLDLSLPNYGIAFSENEFICGSKEKIADSLKSKINNLDVYFRVEYFEFIEDYTSLMFAYWELSTYSKASRQTKLWASKESRKILQVIRAIEKTLSLSYLPTHHIIRNYYIKPKLIQYAQKLKHKGFKSFPSLPKDYTKLNYDPIDSRKICSVSRAKENEILSVCLKKWDKSVCDISKIKKGRTKTLIQEDQTKQIQLIISKLLTIKD